MKTYAAILLASASMVAMAAVPARADDYTDLLNILRAKGSLSQGEYSSLMAKHMHGGRAMRRGHMTEPAYVAPSDEATAQSRRDALAAAASAAAAAADLQKMEVMQQGIEASPDMVHVQPYKPGAGVTMRVGSVDLNFSGIVNGFYTYSSADSAKHSIGGGLADTSGFDSSSVRNGLLPGAFIFTASTTQEGIDVSATFGVYPGINSASVGVLNANSGGAANALGTAGGDFRKTFMTFGTKDLGTIKIGRDLAIFGSDAILNDMTLLSVGASGGNADPANTSLGRIGLGYIYADFQPQITYISPILAGFQATLGVFTPYNEFNFSGLSGTATEHNTPEFEGKLTYDYKGAVVTAHAWAGFMTQPQQGIQAANGTPTNLHHSKLAGAGEGGAVLTLGNASLMGYYYRGTGVGTTGKFFDGIGNNGEFRDSEGGIIQGSYKFTPKFKLAASYGVSNLYLADNEYNPNLVRRSASEDVAAYYTLTDWVTLVGEYAHEEAKSHSTISANSDAISAGAILFY